MVFDLYTIFHLSALLVLLMASSFFSGSETAFFSIQRLEVERMKEAGHRHAGLIENLLGRPRDLISTVLVGNEIVNIMVASVVTSLVVHQAKAMDHLGQTVVSTVVGTSVLLVFGEISPKTVAVHVSQWWVGWAVRPLRGFMWLTYPIRLVMLGIVDAITSMFGILPQARQAALDEDRLRSLVSESEQSGILDAEEKQLIERALILDDIAVSRIMQPIASAYMVREDTHLSDVMKTLPENPYSRIPVFRGTEQDNIVGVLYAKDLLVLLGSDEYKPQRVIDLLRPIERVPASMTAERLLSKMRKGNFHIALVTDVDREEIKGIVTLEDVLEILVGEIHDEKEQGLNGFHDKEAGS